MCPICHTAPQVNLLLRHFIKNRHDYDKLTTMTDHKATSSVLTSENTHRDRGKLRKYFCLSLAISIILRCLGGIQLITKTETWKEITQWQESGTSKPHF